MAIKLDIFDPCHNNCFDKLENLALNLSVSFLLSTANILEILALDVTLT